MSFNILLSTTNVYATNTAGKDYTWAFNFNNNNIENGDYLVSFQFCSGNIAQTNFSSNGPVQLSCDFGNFSTNYLASSNVSQTSTQILGSLKLDWRNSTIETLVANKMDNYPVLFKNINKSSNFIRIHLDGITGALVTTGITEWNIILNFEKQY